jgi:hypothetical protein
MKSEIIALKEPRGGGASTRLFFSIFGELVAFWFLDFFCKYPLGVAVAQLLHGRGDVHYAVFQQPWTMPAFGEP